MKKNTRHTNANAAMAYTKHRGDIDRLIDVLQMELEKHAERFSATQSESGLSRNYGMAGDLSQVRSDLVNAVAFISGMEQGEVERFLIEAE